MMFHPIYIFIWLNVFLRTVQGYYNPIPNGAVIVTTQSSVIVIQTQEYGGSDKLDTIYKVSSGMIILSSVFNPTQRSLSLICRNLTNNGSVFLSQLSSRQQLSSIAYQLTVNFTNTMLMTSDVAHNRAFGTYEDGQVTLFSLSGLLETMIKFPQDIQNIKLVSFNPSNNRLFIITNTELYSCSNLDAGNLECCKASITISDPRWIAFDPNNPYLQCYVLDTDGTIYRFQLNGTGCPTDVATEQITNRASLQLAVDRQFVFAATSSEGNQDNSYLLIRNPNIRPNRFISVGSRIVSLHVSYPTSTSASDNPASCFHGISYNDYRTAVILAAVFGTIMGILLCFNVLFCIDFFMTKSVIRNLKSQIPHNLLEDRWNKLVEEKYAKIALEKARKRDDPPLPPRSLSSVGNRRTATISEATTITTKPTNTTVDPRLAIPKISDYLRRKSESYLNRRRSDDYRTQYNQAELTTMPSNNISRTQMRPVPAHIETVQEENESRGLRQNLSGHGLLQIDADFL